MAIVVGHITVILYYVLISELVVDYEVHLIELETEADRLIECPS